MSYIGDPLYDNGPKNQLAVLRDDINIEKDAICKSCVDARELVNVTSRIFSACKDVENYDCGISFIKNIFKDPLLINKIFMTDDGEVDVQIMNEFYSVILNQPAVVWQALMSCVDNILKNASSFVDNSKYSDFGFVFLFLQNPLIFRKKTIMELRFHQQMLSRIVKVIVKYGQQYTEKFVATFGSYEEGELRKLVQLLNYFLNYQIFKSGQKSYSNLRIVSAVYFMDILVKSNSLNQRLLISEFYNMAIDYYIDLEIDYLRFVNERKESFSFCKYPFMISLGNKIKIIHERSRECTGSGKDKYLNLNVRRDNLLEDSCVQILGNKTELNKKMKVMFAEEDGIDAGGLKKEWFLLVTKGLLGEEYKIFQLEQESNLYWFVNNDENLEMCFLLGVIVGLSIYNQTIIDLPLPLVCYRKLLGYEPNMSDLVGFRPTLSKGLKTLLEYNEDDFEDIFDLNFTIVNTQKTKDEDLKYEEVELIENGRNTRVNSDNKALFINKYIDFIFNKNVERQFGEFKRGFKLVCNEGCLSLFDPEELELLVSGNSIIDANLLKSITEYENIRPDDNIILWYWETIEDFSNSMRRKFLHFVTGTSKIPSVEGSYLRIKVSVIGEDCARFPSSHTCFNKLCIYNYSSKGKLDYYLQRAILESEGFGLR